MVHRGTLLGLVVTFALLALSVIMLLRATGGGGQTAAGPSSPSTQATRSSVPPLPQATPRVVTARGDLAADEQATIELFRRTAGSVVFIATATATQGDFRLRLENIRQGSGTGYIWDEHGHIVTNMHVVEEAARGRGHVRVTLSDQSVYSAKLVGVAPDKDLAVIRIEEKATVGKAIVLGTSHDLVVGQTVFAIGNPFGLDQTLTTGVISGLGREIESRSQRNIYDVIQTDAAINPGNSGGPLLDSAGRLIGVNTAIYSPSGAYAGIGFAIPVDTVNRVVPQLIKYGKIIRPGLGIQIANAQLSARWGIQGVLVLRVQPGSAAENAGIRPTQIDQSEKLFLGDIIQGIGGNKISNDDELYQVLDRHAVGDKLSLQLLRGYRGSDPQSLTVQVELQAIE
jgi:S1-C subfamily serine protease